MAGSEVRAGGAFVEIYAKDTKFRQDMDKAAARFKSFGHSIMGVGAGIAGVGAAIGLGLWEMAKHAAEGGAALAEMSERTGMSVESLSAFKGIVLQAGLEMADFETAIKKMQKAAYGDDAAKLLGKIGKNADEFQRMDPAEQLLTMADALEQFHNPGQRAAVAMEIFGKAGSKMLNVLGGGRGEVEEMMQQMKELGLVSSTEGAEGARKMQRSMILLDMVNKKIVGTIGSALIPVITSLNKMDISSHGNILKTIQANKGWVVSLALVATGMIALGVAVAGVGFIFSTFGTIMAATAGAVKTVYSLLTAFKVLMVVLASSSGALIAAWVILGVAVAGFAIQLALSTERGRRAFARMGATFSDVKEDIVTGWNGIVAALQKGDIATAAIIGMKLIEVEWARMIGAMKVGWYDLINDLNSRWANWSAKIAQAFFNLEAVMLKQQFGGLPGMNDKIERNRRQQIGLVDEQVEIDKKKATEERDGKVAELNKELEKLRADLNKNAAVAAGGGAARARGNGDLIDRVTKVGAVGQYGASNLNQLFGGRDGVGGDAIQNPQVKAVKEVKAEVKKVHGVNLSLLGVAKANFEELRAMKAMNQALYGP